MNSFLKSLRKQSILFQRILRTYLFSNGIISAIINPFYLIRSHLHISIKKNEKFITGNIIDIGCGEKPYELLFRNKKSYIGIDVLLSGHNHANSKIDCYYDGSKIPFSRNTFDSAVCFEVLEHVKNPSLFLHEISRILKPGGKILLTTPFAWEEHEMPYDFQRYTSCGLCLLFESTGFNVISIEKTTTHFIAISQLILAYLSLNIFSRNLIIRITSQILIIFPLTLFFLILNKIIPKHYNYYCNLLIIAEKPINK